MIVSRGLVGPKANPNLVGRKGDRLIFLYSSTHKPTFPASTGKPVSLFKHHSTLEDRNGEKTCKVR